MNNDTVNIYLWFVGIFFIGSSLLILAWCWVGLLAASRKVIRNLPQNQAINEQKAVKLGETDRETVEDADKTKKAFKLPPFEKSV